MSDFAIILVTIEWESDGKLRSIVPSKMVLKPSNFNDKRFEYDLTNYTKDGNSYYQFAIRTSFMPLISEIENNQDRSNQLFNVIEDIWIIKGSWQVGKGGKGYHHCPSINTIGKIKIIIPENENQIKYFIDINVNSNILGFDFEQLKGDFEGELWDLLTSNKSNISISRAEYKYSNQIFQFPESRSILEFIKYFDNISKNPKKELFLSVGLKKVEKVVPVKETYRKILSGYATRLLPSKVLVDKYDVFENRFVCAILRNIHSIVSKNIKYSGLQVLRLENEILEIDHKIEILRNPDPDVDPNSIQEEIQAQEDFYNTWFITWEIQKEIFLAKYPREAEAFVCVTFEVIYRSSERSFWGRLYVGQVQNEYCLLEFLAPCDRILEEQKSQRLSLTVSYIEHGQAGRFKKYLVRAVAPNGLKLISITYLRILDRQRLNYETLKSHNWRQFSILSPFEREKFIQERNNQIGTLNIKRQKIQTQIVNIRDFIIEGSLLEPLLKQRINGKFFNLIKSNNSYEFKPSMTFIQNTNYRNALRSYKEVLASEGIDIEVFDLYEKATNYGVREIPLIYELWSLVTIIKILKESYQFIPISSHLTDLLRIITPKKSVLSEHVKIDFGNSLAGRSVVLNYQMKLADNKRPDFVLVVTCNGRTINVILDSKFKNYKYKQSIVSETVSMVAKYSAIDNFVFILHPCADGKYEDRSIRYTNHGGERIYLNEEQDHRIQFPFHQFGYVEVKPNHTDPLKKLIAMSLQYLIEPTLSAKCDDRRIDPMPKNPLFCLNCGGIDLAITSHKRGDNRMFYTCTCQNIDCSHAIHIDYCWNCKTKLFKHGLYWDYHLESTWSSFDIRCPSCGMTMADRSPLNEA